MKTFLLLNLLIQLAINGETEEEFGIEINPKDDVHLVYFNNFTNVMHIKMRWVAFVFEGELSMEENSPFFIYSQVAREMKGKNFFTKINATIMPHVAEDYLTSIPGIIFFVNKTAYVYTGSIKYEDILERAIQVSNLDWEPEPSPLKQITESNFETIFPNTTYGVLILLGEDDEKRDMIYYGRVKTLSEKLEKDDIPVFYTNKKTDPEVAKKLKIDHIGSIHLIRNGKLYNFKPQAQDHINSMAKYAITHKEFGSKLITDHKIGLYQIRILEAQDLAIFVAVISKIQSSWYSVFEEIVHTMRDDFKFFHIFDRKVGRQFGCLQKICLLPIYPKHLSSPYDAELIKNMQLSLTDLIDLDMVKKYIYKAARPLVGYLSNYVHVLNVYRGQYPRAILYMDVEFEGIAYEENKFYIKKLWKLAYEYPGIIFAFSNREDQESVLKERGIFESENDVDFVIEQTENHYYILEGDFDEDTARTFIDKFLSKSIRPVMKSAPIPTKEFDEHGIRTIVAKNFDKVVINQEKDMIILFYVDRCQHCKKFLPVFEEVASAFKEYDRLGFVKFECGINLPPPEYPVNSYPTVYFAPANDKFNPIKYFQKEESAAGEFFEFIEKHQTTPMEKKYISVGDL